ncbi:hypothetical protein FPQ18DRAFT_341034 [Pyronema domesticum]|nr:hypothetical protein FPQ18DRAFT_341034 [Pyronema domesticum]
MLARGGRRKILVCSPLLLSRWSCCIGHRRESAIEGTSSSGGVVAAEWQREANRLGSTIAEHHPAIITSLPSSSSSHLPSLAVLSFTQNQPPVATALVPELDSHTG